MKQYIAIGLAQYPDSKDTFKTFKAENYTEAKHYIINNFDCSLDWSFMVKPIEGLTQ